MKIKRLFPFNKEASMMILFSLLYSFGVLVTLETGSLADDLKIGVNTCMKMEAGPAMINGAKMAADEINSAGGILGRMIQISHADNECKVDKGIMAFKRQVEKDGVDILVGASVSGILLAQMEFLKQYNKLFMVTGASSPVIAQKVAQDYEKYKYVFRTTFNALELANAISDLEIRHLIDLGYKKFAILAEDAVWNKGLVDFLSKRIPEIGGEVTKTIRFDTSTIDYAPIFSQIASSKADFAVNLIAITDAITLFKQWFESKMPFRMCGFNNPGMFAEWWNRTDGACLSEMNVFAAAAIRAEKTPKTIPFFDNYVKKFGMAPHSDASTTYDAIYLIADAAKRAKSLDTDALIKAMEETDYVGTVGRIVFDQKTHDSKYGVDFIPFLVTQWQDGGKWMVLSPDRFANAKFVNPPWLR
jgi:branched-chain amino acid transport system substrate-binding protein